MMRLSIILLFSSIFHLAFCQVEKLGKCKVGLPKVLASRFIRKSDISGLLASGNWGQKSACKTFWVVFSDRADNVTYEAPGGRTYSKLNFNEKLTIAKISGNYALVYSEPKRETKYPEISDEAVIRGWVPMENLLLWKSCPTNEYFIYNKGVIGNDFELSESYKGLAFCFENPDNIESGKRLCHDLSFYFVMKEQGNMALLARQCKMEGYADDVLYGWVDKKYFIPWCQPICLEPNWNNEDVEYFKANNVNAIVYSDTSLVKPMVRIPFGYKYDRYPQYRIPGSIMRLPLLQKQSDNIYYCLAFCDNKRHLYSVGLNMILQSKVDSLIKVRADKKLLHYDCFGDCIWDSYALSLLSSEEIDNFRQIVQMYPITGYISPKTLNGIALWEPVLYMSSDEFAQLREKLRPVSDAAKNNYIDRRLYIDAIRAIIHALQPDITESELEAMPNDEIMTLISGLNCRINVLKNRTFSEILDKKIVSDEEIMDMIQTIKQITRKLGRIANQGYDFKVSRFGITYYWLPFEDLSLQL